jgi:hypothetical protein
MVASRIGAPGGFGRGRFWVSAFCMALMPTSVGYADIAAHLARQPAISRHPAEHLIASPFGTIEPATFSYGIRPIGTAMPQPPAIELVNFEPGSRDGKVWPIDRPLRTEQASYPTYPTVNRRLKGDRLPSNVPVPAPAAPPQNLPQLQPIDSVPAAQPVQPPAPSPRPVPASRPTHTQAPAAVAPVAQTAADVSAEVAATGEIDSTDGQGSVLASLAFADDDANERSMQIYFGSGAIGAANGLESWAPGAAPVLATPSVDSGIKLAALEGTGSEGPDGEAVAGKDDAAPTQSPAQRLGLAGKARLRAEKCLADAVYFEARGEPLRGQEAVAQVVMNRVFSGYYPNNVCGVVYQNASHYLGCQFTFACEHKDLTRIEEPDMWAQATRIAKDTLDGRIWLADIGHATHYHAYWVHPSWVHEMTRLYKLGVHTFYRPRAWGNGDDAPVWGTPPNTSKADSKPDAAAKGPEAEASPSFGKSATTAKL